MTQPIVVAGAGSWGTALALLLARNNHRVYLHSHDPEHIKQMATQGFNARALSEFHFPENLTVECDLAQLAERSQDWLIVVPSQFFREQILAIQPFMTPQHRIAWASKGLDPTSNQLLHKTVEAILGKNTPIAVIGGPSFSTEVAKKLPTAVVVASNHPLFGEELTAKLHSSSFRVYRSDDVIGVGLGGVLKNIYAIASGICDGLELGANARTALMTRSIAEMLRCGFALGAKAETLLGLAGVGDLILSCTDNQSRNRRLGIALGQNKPLEETLEQIGQVVEGVSNASQVYALAERLHVEMPIATEVHKILNEGRNVQESLKHLLDRQPKSYELKLSE